MERMMSKMIFLNFPVHDLQASTAFYEALGGRLNSQFSNAQTASIQLSEAIVVMLLKHERYASFTKRPIGDARRESQALIALSAESREAVDTTLERTVAAGGKADPNPPQDHGFMRSRSVEDPNGYVWEIVWMDPSAIAGPQ
jgi:predicted lactoylglutathione lyase